MAIRGTPVSGTCEWAVWVPKLQTIVRQKAKDHGAQGGDETQSKIAAVIEQERVFAREEIEEPQIEGLAEIAVLVPVGAETGV